MFASVCVCFVDFKELFLSNQQLFTEIFCCISDVFKLIWGCKVFFIQTEHYLSTVYRIKRSSWFFSPFFLSPLLHSLHCCVHSIKTNNLKESGTRMLKLVYKAERKVRLSCRGFSLSPDTAVQSSDAVIQNQHSWQALGTHLLHLC